MVDATPVGQDDISAALQSIQGGGGAADAVGMSPGAAPPAPPAMPSGDLLRMPAFPSMPKLRDVPKAPQDQFENPMRQFGGPAMFLAALGSLMTRHPMKTALNSASEMIQADVKGQKEQAQLHRENWQMATEQAIAQNRIEVERYKAIMNKYQHDVDTQAAHMMAMASGFNDPQARAMMMQGPDKMWSLIQDREKRGKEAADFMLRQQEVDIKKQDADRRAGMSSQGAINDEALRNMAERWVNGDQNAIRGLGRASPNNPNYARFQNMAAEIAKERGITPQKQMEMVQQFQSAQKLENAFSAGKEGGMVRSMNATIEHLHTAEKLFEALQNGDVQAINRWGNELAKQTGQSPPATFEAARGIIGAEIQKAIVPGGGGVAERLHNAETTLSQAASPKQGKDVLATVRELLGGQLGALEQQWTSNPLHNAKDFEERFLTENSRKELLRASGGGEGAPKEGDRKQFKQGWGVYRNGKWEPEQ